jgi:hypothetical protein
VQSISVVQNRCIKDIRIKRKLFGLACPLVNPMVFEFKKKKDQRKLSSANASLGDRWSDPIGLC